MKETNVVIFLCRINVCRRMRKKTLVIVTIYTMKMTRFRLYEDYNNDCHIVKTRRKKERV